jgi:hypothetical protein
MSALRAGRLRFLTAMRAVEQHTGGSRWLWCIATGFSSAERSSQGERYSNDEDNDD